MFELILVILNLFLELIFLRQQQKTIIVVIVVVVIVVVGHDLTNRLQSSSVMTLLKRICSLPSRMGYERQPSQRGNLKPTPGNQRKPIKDCVLRMAAPGAQLILLSSF